MTATSPLDHHAAPTASATSGKATAALVIGIVAVIGILIPIAGLILGIVAVALSRAARGSWQASAGLWLGILAIAGSLANWILTAIQLSS